MSSLEQCEHNIALFETDAPLTPAERRALEGIAAARLAKRTVPCTACRYCLDQCPSELNIPYLIALYNEFISRDDEKWLSMLKLDALPEEELPAECIECHSCARVCPQRIDPAEVFNDFIDLLSRMG